MKEYDIYFTIKANNTQYANKLHVLAKTATEAKSLVRKCVMMHTGKHTFHLSTKQGSDYGRVPEYPMPHEVLDAVL